MRRKLLPGLLALTLVLLLAHAALVVGLIVLRQEGVFLLPAWMHLLPALALLAAAAVALDGRRQKVQPPSQRQYLALALLSAMAIGIWGRPETRALWNAPEQLLSWSKGVLTLKPEQVCIAMDGTKDDHAAPSWPWSCLVKNELLSPTIVALHPTYVTACWDRLGQGHVRLDWGGGFLEGRGLVVGSFAADSEFNRRRQIRNGVWVYHSEDE